ncbi:(2Fe-2S)-binding protein OS=Streptomyces cyaneofuscatus OX=66883 GN=G3I52_31710 PE=4 SV=1 [Streptomyces cyaneofuscatus]
MVTVFGEPVVVTLDEDGDVRAYRVSAAASGCFAARPGALSYGMIFVNLYERDHRLAGAGVPPVRTISATPRSA